MNQNKELVEAIERLGKYLINCINLTEGIRNIVKDRDGIHNYNVDIITMLRCLREASEYYTYFHSHYLGKLARKH